MNVSSSPRNIPTTTPLPILVSSTELQRTSAPDVLVTTHDCTISDSVDAAAVRADSPAQSIDAPGGLLTGISSFESLSSSGTDDSTRVAMSSYTGPNSGATSPTELQDGSGLGSDIRSPVEPQEISAVTPTPTISTTAQNDIDRLEAESRAPDASDTEPNEASTARSGKLPQILSSTLSIPAANDSATGISHPKILLKLNLKTTSLVRGLLADSSVSKLTYIFLW
ncbi:hypothetical protein DL93DRAFT_241268 [Clavulina sp. PMI_390]|nr:hypothetical protein DL93DRAFT_241268 [Clavulina sp. PMI_390]